MKRSTRLSELHKEWHSMIHNYAYSMFHETEFGEWYGYLNRDGTVSQTAKGNLFKGPLHLPRHEWYCGKMIRDLMKE